MSDLLISVECGEKTCGACKWRHRLAFCGLFFTTAERMVRLHYWQGQIARCPACLAAEKRAKGLPR